MRKFDYDKEDIYDAVGLEMPGVATKMTELMSPLIDAMEKGEDPRKTKIKTIEQLCEAMMYDEDMFILSATLVVARHIEMIERYMATKKMESVPIEAIACALGGLSGGAIEGGISLADIMEKLSKGLHVKDENCGDCSACNDKKDTGNKKTEMPH